MLGLWDWSTTYSCKGWDSKPRKGYQVQGIAVGITIRFTTTDFHQKFSFKQKHTLRFSLSLIFADFF